MIQRENKIMKTAAAFSKKHKKATAFPSKMVFVSIMIVHDASLSLLSRSISTRSRVAHGNLPYGEPPSEPSVPCDGWRGAK